MAESYFLKHNNFSDHGIYSAESYCLGYYNYQTSENIPFHRAKKEIADDLCTGEKEGNSYVI